MATIDRHATVPLLGGVALGAVDLAAQKLLPYPWANLANSSAVWAVLAFAMAYRLRGGVLRSVGAAIVMLVVAVPVYYLTATVVQHDDVANLWASTALLWMFFGVLAGAVFGVAAAWARDGGWRGVVGVALPAAVLLAEAVRLARRDEPATAIIEAVLAVAVVLLAGRTWRRRGLGAAVAVPLALLGFLGFQIAGFA
ncbi:DUF6518 family protein [Couchioplanes caeruleus]|uniref:DUF6518 family protein n=1 Tax=Couchioplanes caeruleus TaxID=56438 RepID=UPI0020BFB3B6|nr:DUF6518 family protein [Couchioplanes caeruleus]UQU65140.1 DUF6518 family protein [Couchioplanes caeruleus]